ncbi:MAG TPA: tRNA (adenosine(37)-N6)-threonylcarbamoyltransferase complex ATPase subunit type 1 TsaE [Candidatus Cloacimonetes bacterium]|nr:tRNA (adenosine(37)-N6)-threonylcarbamoyltransferase complex ATPase subunit type 1 TsaE [Candidatus Cloacimonadota bacterium]
MTLTFELDSLEDTAAFARKLQPLLKRGDVICLSGDLGSGKTTFVQALGQALGIQEDIDSPSFVMLKEYHSGRLPLYHLDLYRIREPHELMDLGLFDIIENGVTAIEWPQIAEQLFPYQTLSLHFEYDGESRKLKVQGEEEYLVILKEYIQNKEI